MVTNSPLMRMLSITPPANSKKEFEHATIAPKSRTGSIGTGTPFFHVKAVDGDKGAEVKDTCRLGKPP